MTRQKQYILGFKVIKTFWITFHTAKHYFSTIFPTIMRLFIKNGSHGWRTSCIWTVNFKQLHEVEFHSIKGALSSVRKHFGHWKPFKNDWKYFSPSIFFSLSRHLNFCLEVVSNNGLIRNISLISKIMTPQTG